MPGEELNGLMQKNYGFISPEEGKRRFFTCINLRKSKLRKRENQK